MPTQRDDLIILLEVRRHVEDALATLDLERGPSRAIEHIRRLVMPPEAPAENEYETRAHLKRVVSLLVQRCGDRTGFTPADLARADQLQLRWNNNGHRIELCTLKDT